MATKLVLSRVIKPNISTTFKNTSSAGVFKSVVINSKPNLLRSSTSILSSKRTTQNVKNLTTTSLRKRDFHSSFPLQSIVQFKLADIGEGIAECEILKWHVKEGDKIHQFDLLCEVQSDKATVEITSRYDGVIRKLHYNKGDMAKVGSPLVDIEAVGAVAEQSHGHGHGHGSPAPKAESTKPAPTPSHENLTKINETVLATPAVRHIAARNQINLKQVAGSGRDGRILKEDVLRIISGATAPTTAAVSQPTPVTPPTQPPVQPPITVTAQDRVVPLSGYSRVMAKTMTIANSIPHFGYCDEIIVDRLMAFRQELKKIAESRGIKLTLMPIIIKATSLALKQFPALNSSYDEPKNSMIYKASHNIGVAVDTPNGLVVPNIKNCQDKSIFEIAAELNRIHQSALKAAVAKEDLTGGTFSLSNIGTIGGTYASPVIVPPEVAIGAIGKIQKLPRYDAEDRVVPVHIMNISWSADHRVIDGATMANFSNLWKKYLEHPNMMLLDTK